MLSIDGSYGEGGGQILRTAVSLSVLTKTPIKVTDIRANRSNPGLRPQHYVALSIMKQLSNAETKGLTIGSSEIEFHPKSIRPGSFEFDIGTAGSMVLVFQTILLGMLHTPQRIHIRLHGGSDVKWSPSWDYFSEVFLPVVHHMGVPVSAQLCKRGYYPKGGGIAELTIDPGPELLSPIVFDSFHPDHVAGLIHLSGLPDHIAKRMKHEVVKQAMKKDVHCSIRTQVAESLSAGVGLTLWSRSKQGCFGAVSLGEKGVAAETVGKTAVDSMLADITSNATVDVWLSDQILPYFALADGSSSFLVRKIAGHCKTNRWVLEQFFQDELFSFDPVDKSVRVICEK